MNSVTISKKLQAEGKVKFGYVAGASMNNSWFTWFWSMWGNNCDVLMPFYERDNKKLAAAGWKSSMTEPCMQKTVEYWWDAINTHKIVPRGMPAYDRNEANAVFTSGDAAFTVADTWWWGTFNDPAKSKIAGKVAAARFPLGPDRAKPFGWDDIWGWAIPKSIPEERKKLAKQMLNAMMLDKEGQIKMFTATGAPPPNTSFWPGDRSTGTLHEAPEGGCAGFARQGARRLLLPAMARRAQGLQRHRDQGGDRQARGHRQGPRRRRTAGEQGGAVAHKRRPPRMPRRALLSVTGSVTAEMAAITLNKLNKHYGSVFHAVKDVDLEIADKEFVALVGPSGCGKSTTLRMIAGLEDISSGEIRIGDRVVNHLPPRDRDVAMVFQNYAPIST